MNLIIVDGDQARLYGTPKAIPQGQSQFSQVQFSFSEEWTNLRKIAQFEQKGNIYNVEVSDDRCFCPSELVKGGVNVRIKGYPRDTASAVIATANEVVLPVSVGFQSGGIPSAPPTPDLYQKLIEEFSDKVQSNWNQNDPTAKDYVKNRCGGWVEPSVEPIILYDGTVEKSGETKIAQFPTIATSGKITVDDVATSYTCIDEQLGSDENFTTFGTKTAKDYISGNFSEDDILVASMGDISLAIIGGSYIGKHLVISVYEGIIHTIPVKFLDTQLLKRVGEIENKATSAQEAVDEIQSTGLSFIGSIGNTVFIGTDSDGQARIGNRHSPRARPGGVDTLLVPAGLSFRYYDYHGTLINQVILSVSGKKDEPFLYLNNGTIRVYSEPKEDNEVATKSYVDSAALPPVTTEDNGKILKVMDGAWAMDIPSDGTDISLGLTSTTVGQIAKISAVDDSGKPTAWEAVDMPTGGGERTFEKVVEMTTAEDAAVISISTDKNGNPLSMSEFYVAITTARNSAATANNNFNCNVLPDTVPSYVRSASAIKSLMLFQDVYCYVMHYKVVGGMIFHEYTGRVRTSSGLNVAKYLENEKNIGISTDRGETIGFLSPPYAGNGVSKIDSAGKMYCITFGADSTNCIFGAGTRVEVWAR